MSYRAIREYLIKLLSLYKNAKSRQEKTQMLDMAEKFTGLSRKHIIRQMKLDSNQIKFKKKSGRPPKYKKNELMEPIKELYINMERISPKRMKAALKIWLPMYDIEPRIKNLLQQMSASTLERFLREIRKTSQKGISTTSPARYMKNKVPINTLDHKVTKPGFMQADTVAHCGTSAAGAFANTVTMTDIESTWTENRAIWQKKGNQIRKQFANIKISLPFEMLAVNVDSGSEFLNTPVLNFMNPPSGKKITFTRSRPYKKNDNCYVEQKNYTHVRELFGYQRIDSPDLIPLMNKIYSIWNPFLNFFIPTFKLLKKTRIGGRIIKKYDDPQTPCDRLLKSNHITDDKKRELMDKRNSLNPFLMKKELEALLNIFFEKLRSSTTKEAA